MPRVLDELPKRDFSARKASSGRSEKYPFDEWFDGKIRLLIEGEDFQSKRGSMSTNLYNAARKRGLKIRTVNTPEGIVVQSLGAVPVEVVENGNPTPTDGATSATLLQGSADGAEQEDLTDDDDDDEDEEWD